MAENTEVEKYWGVKCKQGLQSSGVLTLLKKWQKDQ